MRVFLFLNMCLCIVLFLIGRFAGDNVGYNDHLTYIDVIARMGWRDFFCFPPFPFLLGILSVIFLSYFIFRGNDPRLRTITFSFTLILPLILSGFDKGWLLAAVFSPLFSIFFLASLFTGQVNTEFLARGHLILSAMGFWYLGHGVILVHCLVSYLRRHCLPCNQCDFRSNDRTPVHGKQDCW